MARVLIKLTLALSLMALCASASGSALADVMVRPTSEVAAVNVTLADIASVQCADEALAAKLRTIPICPSALPGKTRVLAREQIIIALRRQGVSDDSVNLLCPGQVAVTRSSSVASGQALFEAAREFALRDSGWPGTVTVEPVRIPPDQVVPLGKLELRVRPGAQNLRKGRNSLPVESVVDGQVYTTTHVSILVRVFAPVLVAAQTIPRSTQITAANSALRDREITTLGNDIVLESPTAGMVAAVPIPEGAVVRKAWISAPPAVRSGDAVTVVVDGSCVRVTDKGIAAADGRPGDRIKVRLTGDVREVRGTVVGPGLVQILIDRGN
jgi:flagella basal body P-ring formation protein FlgA